MRVNKKMRRGALRSALTDALQSGKLAVVNDIAFDEPKTRDAVELLDALELDGKVLVVLPEPQEVVEKSFRNLRHVRITYAKSLGTYEILRADRVLFTDAALGVLEGCGGGGAVKSPRDVIIRPDRLREVLRGDRAEHVHVPGRPAREQDRDQGGRPGHLGRDA